MTAFFFSFFLSLSYSGGFRLSWELCTFGVFIRDNRTAIDWTSTRAPARPSRRAGGPTVCQTKKLACRHIRRTIPRIQVFLPYHKIPIWSGYFSSKPLYTTWFECCRMSQEKLFQAHHRASSSLLHTSAPPTRAQSAARANASLALSSSPLLQASGILRAIAPKPCLVCGASRCPRCRRLRRCARRVSMPLVLWCAPNRRKKYNKA